jgi:hypothetical protein
MNERVERQECRGDGEKRSTARYPKPNEHKGNAREQVCAADVAYKVRIEWTMSGHTWLKPVPSFRRDKH